MPSGTQGTAARQLSFQAVHYLRKGITFDETGIGTASTVKFANPLPANAVVYSVQVLVTEAFNAVTTNYINVGTSSNDDVYVDNDASISDVDATATGSTIVWRGGDEYNTSATTVYVTYTETGTAATAGAAEIIISYSVDNDR